MKGFVQGVILLGLACVACGSDAGPTTFDGQLVLTDGIGGQQVLIGDSTLLARVPAGDEVDGFCIVFDDSQFIETSIEFDDGRRFSRLSVRQTSMESTSEVAVTYLDASFSGPCSAITDTSGEIRVTLDACVLSAFPTGTVTLSGELTFSGCERR
ncbi:MAG: hypothetical protein AAF938_09225 [Myxococcota bacterium]